VWPALRVLFFISLEEFRVNDILLVTSSFASAYLMAMAGGNLAGRLGWAAVSDKIGKIYYEA